MLARFVLRLEPVASADLDTVVAWYAPTVQRYLIDPLASGPAAVSRPPPQAFICAMLSHVRIY